MVDTAVLCFFKGKNFGLSAHAGAVFKGGLQLHIGVGHRQDPPGDGHDLTHPGHRLVKGVGDAVQRRQQQVPKRLACQPPLGEAVGQQLLHQRLRIGQGLHTVADVPRGRHPQILPEHAGATDVIRHGDDGGQVSGIELQAPENSR